MNTKQSAAIMAATAATLAADKNPVKKPEITKQQVINFIHTFIFVSVSYSGNDNTFYIRGVQAKDAELAVLKAFPGMPFKTQSNTEPPTRDAKDYYFSANGDMVNNLASNIVFECKARTARNAKRKFGNYITSLTAGTNVKATREYAKNPAEAAEKLGL